MQSSLFHGDSNEALEDEAINTNVKAQEDVHSKEVIFLKFSLSYEGLSLSLNVDVTHKKFKSNGLKISCDEYILFSTTVQPLARLLHSNEVHIL